MPKHPTTPTERGAKHLVATNRRARHEYEILEPYEVGISLAGTEVKSIRSSKVSLQEAYCRIEGNEAWIYGMYIQPFPQGNRFNLEPNRRRKLLLHRWEINRLRAHTEQKGLTLVPLSLYFERGFVKLEIGLAKGKKIYDRRKDIAERDTERERRRELFQRN